MILFARRVAHVITVDRVLSDDGTLASYTVNGPLFFGSSNDLVDRFAYAEDPARVRIDLTGADEGHDDGGGLLRRVMTAQ